MFWFGLVSLFEGISIFVGYLILRAILVGQLGHYLTHTVGDKGVCMFLKGISPKVNIKAQLEFELTYNDDFVQHVNHYTIGNHR